MECIIEGNNVITICNISLLESLEGVEKLVSSIDGPTKITISPKTYNCDEITIPKLGVNREGYEKVIIKVKYPDEISSLINVLKQNKEI